jgi:plasmid stabilization system protein ParE
MAKEIRWSVRADQDRLEIIEYWTNRNKSTHYSIKLARLFIEKVEFLAQSPGLGKATKSPFVRVKIVRDYFIYYNIESTYIEIITIWDSRRNPAKFKL